MEPSAKVPHPETLRLATRSLLRAMEEPPVGAGGPLVGSRAVSLEKKVMPPLLAGAWVLFGGCSHTP